MARVRTEATPISWLHVVGMIVVLWAVSSETFAQVREVVVTEVRGTATRGNAAPLRILDSLKVGDRVRLSSDSHIDFFSAPDARLYMVSGPAEIVVTAQGVNANGKPMAPKLMSDAYRNLKISAPDLVQGSMVMRNAAEASIVGPEGVVAENAARHFSWIAASGTLRFELATQGGDVLYRANVRGESIVLPPEVPLIAGERYVWGILPASGTSTPLDWTEFSVAAAGTASALPGGATSTDKVLYAAWLKSQGMERAALRSLAFARN